MPDDVDPEAPEITGAVTDVDRAAGLQALPQGVVDDLPHELGALLLGELAVLDRNQVVVDAQERRQADGEMDVRAALLAPDLEERVDP